MKQGAAKAVTVVTNPERIQKGPAWPLVGLTGSKRHIEAGAVQPVYHVDADYVRRHGLEKGEPMPVIAVASAGREVMDGRAIPVYLVSGTLGDETPITPVVPTYIERVLAIAPANLLAYWLMNEAVGVTADNAEGTAARDGTYNAVTLANTLGPDGVNNAPRFYDATGDYLDIYSASLNSVFNGQLATISIWGKVFNAGIWTDGGYRRLIHLQVDANNDISLMRDGANNGYILNRYNAGGTVQEDRFDTGSTLDWFNLAVTINKAGDIVRIYFNGADTGVTLSGLGNWAGNLAATNTAIGTTTVPEGWSDWNGWLAHAAIWNTVLSPAQIAQVGIV